MALKKAAKVIKNMGFQVKFSGFKVNNILASADVGFKISLDKLSHTHNGLCQYEPEIFPGLIYRMYSPKVTLEIFASGKIILTGAKTVEVIHEAYNLMFPHLQWYKKNDRKADD